MKVTIVGGGLVGSLSAVMFGQQGHDVDLYEMRSDPKDLPESAKKGRSINLALSNRGRRALEKCGLEKKVLDVSIPMIGRMLHGKDGETTPVLYDPIEGQCIYSVSRSFLNELLLEGKFSIITPNYTYHIMQTDTEAANYANVNIHFDSRLENVDPETGVAKFADCNSNFYEVHSDLIIGADGARSNVRDSIIKRVMTTYSQKYIEHGYIELCIPAAEDGAFAMEKNYLHIWPRGEYMLIALPNGDGSFTATLFMPYQMFSSITSKAEMLTFFQQSFPDVITLIGQHKLGHDFFFKPPSSLISISCDPINNGKAVLLGDSAHAMVPFYGQGMNAGFEDLMVLQEILSTSSSPLEQQLSDYSKTRIPDAQSICDLALYNYTEMRHHVNQKGFYFRRWIDTLLYKIVGRSWTPLYTSVTFSTIPYSTCMKNKKWQDSVLKSALSYTVGTFVVVLGVASLVIVR